jgi:hypothetical protein
MKIEIIKLGPLLLGGMSFYGDPISSKGSWDSENEIGKTCQRFTEFIKENPKRLYSQNEPFLYEIHIYGNETKSKGFFEVFIGEEINTSPLPLALSSKYIPASSYLNIVLFGQEIVTDWWQELDTRIIPSMGVKRNFAYIIQKYDDKFSMRSIGDSTMNALIPVENV